MSEGGRAMRMLLKIKMPTESGNRAIKDGSLRKLLEDTIRKSLVGTYPQALSAS